MNLNTLSLLLALPLAACTDTKNDDDTAAPDDDNGGGDSEDSRTGAYADIELTYETTGGEVTTWSFRLEDGALSSTESGYGYKDVVTVTPDNDDDGDLFYARHQGCWEGASDSEPTDRPVVLLLRKGSAWDSVTGHFELELAPEDCESDSNEDPEYECIAGPGAEGSYFELATQDAGQFWSGTFSAYAYCVDREGEGDHVGYAQVVATFEAREEEP